MANNHDKHPTQKIFADRWYRFNRYEIAEGYIRPAKDATIESYEPWKAFRAPAGKEGIKQPYEPLLQLAKKIDLDYSTIRLQGEAEDHVLDWCSQYGLLGLLLHRVETVILPAQERFPGSNIRASGPLPISTTFVRTNSGWATGWVLPQTSSSAKPGVYLRRELGSFDIRFERLSETWGLYFPAVPVDKRDSHQYATPFTPEFWRQYAEPVSSFVGAAKMFREAVDNLRRMSTRSGLSQNEMRAALGGDAMINGLAAPVRPMLYQAPRGYGLGWACHSLLAAFSMMVMLDLSRARLLECKNPTCRSLFVSKAAAGKYCNPTCRGTVQMRKYRRRQKRAQKPRGRVLLTR
jgi:predicted RNA-binding Zn ribbon-like protein